jgi:hypothetical protein
MPHLSDPKLLLDFFRDSYEVGGGTSILALQGVFQLMFHHNLDYPDFYPKLYSLLNAQIFHMKYSSRFLRSVTSRGSGSVCPCPYMCQYLLPCPCSCLCPCLCPCLCLRLCVCASALARGTVHFVAWEFVHSAGAVVLSQLQSMRSNQSTI